MTVVPKLGGRDRPVNSKPVAHVETLLCNGVLGRRHRLTNRSEDGRLVTYCDGCGETWSALDAGVRG